MASKELDLTTKKLLSWENVIEMSDNMITFGAHAKTHDILSQVPLEIAEKEICQSKKEIENHILKDVISFAYPVGNKKTFNDNIINILKQNGFQCAVTTIKGFVDSSDDLFALKRYNIDGEDSFDTFKCKLLGVYELLNFIISCFKKINCKVRKLTCIIDLEE